MHLEQVVKDFNITHGILSHPPQEFHERFLQYRFNSLQPQFQELLMNDVLLKFNQISAAILTAKKGFISRKVLRKHTRSLLKIPDLFPSVLQLYREALQPYQQNLFYFGGHGSSIKVEKTTWPFQNGFGFCIWVQFEKVRHDLFNENNYCAQKLISVHGKGQNEGGGLECFVLKDAVYYRVLPANYSEPTMSSGIICLGQFKQGMNFIGLSHENPRTFGSSHLTICFNSDPPRTLTLDYPKLQSSTTLERFAVCENLFGQASCVIIMNQCSSKIKAIQQHYANVLMDQKQIKTLPATLEKYFERIMTIYLPEMTNERKVQDALGCCNGNLVGNSGFVLADRNKFHQLGGFRLYNMMLQMSGHNFKTPAQGAKQIGTMIEILNDVMANNNSLQQEAANISFFATFGVIIQSFPEPLLGQQALDALTSLKAKLFDPKLMDSFFLNVLWNPQVQQKCANEQQFSRLLQLGCQLYIQNPQHFAQYLTFKDLMDFLVFSFPDIQCCSLHYQDYEPSYQVQLFEKIVYLMNQTNDLVENILIFDNYLQAKISPCLLSHFLNMFMQILFETGDPQKIQQILYQWYQNNVVQTLLFLFKTQPFYDIRAQIISILSLILSQNFNDYKLQRFDAIEFVVNSLEPLWETDASPSQKQKPLQQQSSQKLKQVMPQAQDKQEPPIKQIVQPKPVGIQLQQNHQEEEVPFDDLKNIGTQFLNTDYESVPQAPSMTNRRKNDQSYFHSKRQPPRALSIQPPEVEKPKTSSHSVDQKAKRKFNLKIDTEQINSLYNYGGEQGRKNQFDEEAFQKELQVIYDLAHQCVLHMQGAKNEKKEVSPKAQKQVQAPLSTKNQQNPKTKPQFEQLNSIKEVSSSSISIVQIESQQLIQKRRAQSLQQTYNALLGWVVGKVRQIMMIEEGDLIQNAEILIGILKIFNLSSEEQLKAQILQDLLCLTKSHQNNCSLILFQESFTNELLGILSSLEKSCLIYEIGQRLYLTLITQAMKSDIGGADFIFKMLMWGQQKNQKKFVLQISQQIIDQVAEHSKLFLADMNSIIWQNIVKLGFYIYKFSDYQSELNPAYQKCMEIFLKDLPISGLEQEVEIQQQQLIRLITQPPTFLHNQFQILTYQMNQVEFAQVLLELLSYNLLNKVLIIYAIGSDLFTKQPTSSQTLQLIIGKLNEHPQQKEHIKLLMLISEIFTSKIGMIPVTQQLMEQHLGSAFQNFLENQLANKFKNLDKFIAESGFLEKIVFQRQLYEVPKPKSWEMKTGVDLNMLQKDIQVYGEMKYIETNGRKKVWLQIMSERERIGKNKFHKQACQIVSYNGWLAPQDFFEYSQRNSLMKDTTEELRYSPYYTVKQSKWLTRCMYRPYLKLVPKIPDCLQLKSAIQFGNQISVIFPGEDRVEPLYGQQQIIKTASQIINVGRAIGNNIRNTFKTMLPAQPQQQKQNPLQMQDLKAYAEDMFKGKRVTIIFSLFFCAGLLTLSETHLIFQYDSLRQDQSHASLASFQLKDHQRLVKRWPIAFLQQVIKKKYLQKKNALELFFIDGKSIFLNIPDQADLDEIASKLLRLRKSLKAPHFIQSKSTDPLKLLETSGIAQKWSRQQISNFKYLLYLNNLASRSFNDLTQYPVLPWVLMESQTKPFKEETMQQSIRIYPDKCFRPMKMTMGSLGSNSRIKSYIERFESTQSNSEVPPFHFGSHYSSPAITAQYLIRLEPFTSASKEIQGGRFDIADRIFYSIKECFRCATEDVADVRELIPEIFCLPEMFLNLQRLNFGQTQNKHVVNSVQLPEWCNGNCWRYVVGMRNALESEEVQKELPEWIDLIFGFKSRGKEADKCLNKFFYLTYENMISWEKLDALKLSTETQIVNFGITPYQLFVKPHPPRMIEQDQRNVTHLNSELKVYRPPNKKRLPNTMGEIVNIQQASNRAIVKIIWLSEVRLLCLRKEGKAEFLKWNNLIDQPSPNNPPFQCGLEKEKVFNLEKPQGEPFNIWDSTAVLQHYPLIVLNGGKFLVVGGYWLGKLITFTEANQIYDKVQLHTDTITVIAKEKKDEFVYTGDKAGQVIMWKVGQDYRLTARRQYFDHYDKILVLQVEARLRLFGTGCAEGIINLYNMYNGTFLRSFQHPNRNPISMMIMSSRPLACVVFGSCQDSQLYSFSINGFLLEVAKEDCKSLIEAQTIRNSSFQDVLVYGTESGDVVMRALPYLQQFKRFPISQKSPVLSISRSKDKKYLLCGCNDGEISVMAESQVKN